MFSAPLSFSRVCRCRFASRPGIRTPGRALDSFRRDEDGGLVIFTLYVLVGMLLAVGMALDTVRFEFNRIRLQNTLDGAVLTAASLTQPLDPETVVRDYFKKAGLSDQLSSVNVDSGFNYRSVDARSTADMNTMFMNMVGIDTMSILAAGTAQESVEDLEVAMVLDNSGSMNSNGRLGLLKVAAKDFIDAVAREDGDTERTTAISIVPFASQVSAGADLMAEFDTTGEHDKSYCINFQDSDYRTAEMPSTTKYKQVAYFDYTKSTGAPRTPYTRYICTFTDDNNRHITPWSTNAAYLKRRIDDMYAEGSTSIEIGAKWGAALLDPSTKDALNSLVYQGKVESKLVGQPFDYDTENTMKVMVLMSDGANQWNWDIKDGYRSGDSPLLESQVTVKKCSWYSCVYEKQTTYVYHDPNRYGNKYWYQSDDEWHADPGENAKRFTWPEVWEKMRAYAFADLKRDALGGYTSSYYDQIVEWKEMDDKDDRTYDICKAAKDAGVMIFTIGLEAGYDGNLVLAECASSANHFYDVKEMDIDTAFAAIARQINQLRLTQ